MKYTFRGLDLFEYNPETKKLVVVMDIWGLNEANIEQCKLIPEDYILLAQFFTGIHLYETGMIDVMDLKDMVVN